MKISVVFVEPESGEIISEGELAVKGNDRRAVLMRCQKLFGPMRGRTDDTYRFLSADGMLVKVSF